MAVVLEGGCRVSTMHEGVPYVAGSLRIWNQVGTANGAEAISLRILEFGPGVSPGWRNRECDEVLYLLEDFDDERLCTVFIDETPYEVSSQTGIYLRPGQTFSVENAGPVAVRFVSSQCPEEVFTGTVETSLDHPASPRPAPIMAPHWSMFPIIEIAPAKVAAMVPTRMSRF